MDVFKYVIFRHYKGRVFAALANGSIAVFHRAKNGCWSTAGYHVIRLGQTSSSVCNLTVVHDKIWVAYRNCVAILNPDSLLIEDAFVARKQFYSKRSQNRDRENGSGFFCTNI